MKIKAVGLSEKGNFRKENQDFLNYYKNSDGSFLAIICDGMGGHKHGEIASRLAVDTLVDLFKKTSFDKKESKEIFSWLEKSVSYIINVMKKYVEDFIEAKDMGTTLSAILIANNNAHIINIGDSRIYHLKDQSLNQITIDQNLMNSNYDIQKIRQQAQRYYGTKFNENTYWKSLTSALGPAKKLKIDSYFLKNSNGLFCLTTDGIHDFIDSKTFKDYLDLKSSLKTKAKNIIKYSINNLSTDNLSIILLEVL
ncbi:PP2C family protein-serine/threonine phosphatase [Mycoplasma mycoides]|uniref:PP2C family protein-serine/threonine phosphatase n=1 Tax=Mycoplasma mycoides TaxID=2102 RepID=UPI0027327EB0|nr:PP2C family serine/threonine-protein phosphatase [Mycoplasma mycoides]MDP4040155.1 serine/threonine-protein phosphatase [Mycoplasma mycoides]MDP4041022.1 serine/threonine-protein phosphatase [Mycoplasma mycoides]MDP4042033.1 serine/threonine-protein phosphatase [Mycoplasma mycoides]MDP4043910.1 serine/threonine-protein phosphatase [Mycoplasma mycoides]MDP4044794.1 serine/threonine-protein phosphatase [Mycoplasma mycoides]